MARTASDPPKADAEDARAEQAPEKTGSKSGDGADAPERDDSGNGVRPVRLAGEGAPDSGGGVPAGAGTAAADIPEHSRQVAKGSFWSLAGNVFFKLVSFLYAILVARAAAQDDVGLFNLSLSIVTIVMVFSDLGLVSSLQRFVPYYEGKGEKGKILSLLRTAYAIVVVAGVLFMAFLWLSADSIGAAYQSPGLPAAIRMLVPFILFGGVFRLHYTYMQGRTDMRSMQMVQNSQNALKLALTAAFFYAYGASVLSMSAAFVISHVIAIALSIPYMRKDTEGLGGTAFLSRGEMVREILPFGAMLSILNSFATAIASADRVLLGYLIPPAEALRTVAIYSYASALSVVLIVLPAAIEATFLPVISRLVGKGDISLIRSATDTAQRWTLLVTMPLAIVMIVFSGDIIGVLFGDAYRPGALAMSIITFAYLVRCYASVLANTLAAMRLIGLELRIYLATAAVNVALNILLIPPLGMEGSALAIVASFALMLVLFHHYSRKIFGFSFKGEVFRITAAGAVAFVVILALSSFFSSFVSSLPQFGPASLAPYSSKIIYLAYLALLMGLTGAVFGASCLALRCLHPEDVAILDKALRKARVPRPLSSLAVRTAEMGLGTRK